MVHKVGVWPHEPLKTSSKLELEAPLMVWLAILVRPPQADSAKAGLSKTVSVMQPPMHALSAATRADFTCGSCAKHGFQTAFLFTIGCRRCLVVLIGTTCGVCFAAVTRMMT